MKPYNQEKRQKSQFFDFCAINSFFKVFKIQDNII